LFSIVRPSERAIFRQLEQQALCDVTYAEVGATAGELPAGFFHNGHAESIGLGVGEFQVACRALEQWCCFDIDWVTPYSDGPPERGRCVAILANIRGMWLLNCCRIVEVMRDSHGFSFALGTLPQHAAQGEERVSLALEPASGVVTFEICSFSRPGKWFANWTRHFVEQRQIRFAREATQRMRGIIDRSRRLGCHQ